MTTGVILALVSAFTPIALAQQPDGTVSVETRAWVGAKIYASIQMYFAHAEGAPGFDLDRDFSAYTQAAFAASDRYQFDLATISFMGKLRNGHSSFSDSWLDENYGQDLGFTIQPMTEGWVVTESQLADLNPGDVVLSINGKLIEQFYREIDPMLEGSSEIMRRRSFSFRPYLWPERFQLATATGKQITIDRITQKLLPARTFPFSQDLVKPPQGVGYLRISSFDDPKQEASLVRQVRQLNSARAIILDVRGNGGGNTPDQLIDALLDRPWSYFRFSTPLSIAIAGAENQVQANIGKDLNDPYLKGYLDAYSEFRKIEILSPSPLHVPAGDAYKGKVFLLVDGFCSSACEDFVLPFKTTGRGVLVGEPTSGSSGQPYYFDFGNRMSFRVSSKRYYLPDGSPFEGVGLAPDIPIKPSLEDLKAGRDPVLVRALDMASQE